MTSKISKRLLEASIIAFVAVVGLTACSGGSGSTTQPETVTPPPPAPTGVTFSLDGASTKGLILNGYAEVTDAADDTNSLVSGRTSDVDGTYDVTIPDTANFEGPFIKITVSGGADAVMICDAGDGCITDAGTTAAFGETFAIGENVTLSAIVPTPADNGTDTVNLNIFTDLAAALVESASGALTEANINEANAQVSNLFGLVTVDPTELAPVNLADAMASSTDGNALRAAILSGGALGAALENGADIGTALENLRASFAANSGQIVVNEAIDDPALISLEDIFGEATNAANESEIVGDDFDQAKAEILGEAIGASAAEAGSVSTANVAPSNDAPPLDQAKMFISDLQLIVEAVQSQENEDNFVEFADRVETAAQLLEDDAETALETAFDGATAIAQAYEAYQDDNTLTSFQANGLTVDISSPNGVLALDIASQTLRNETIQMSVSGDLEVEVTEIDTSDSSADGTSFEGEEGTAIVIDGDALLSGMVENSAISLEILNGEVSVLGGQTNNSFSFAGRSDQTRSDNQSVESNIILAEKASGSLDVKVNQKTEQGLAFEGQIAASLVAPRFENSSVFLSRSNFNGFSNFNAESGTLNASLNAANIGFSGSLSEGGQFVDVTFALQSEATSLRVSDEATPQDVQSYTVSNNVLSFQSDTSDATYELLDQAEAQAELDELVALGASVLPFRDGASIYRLDGRFVAIANIPEPDAQVLRLTSITRETQVEGITVYVQAGTISSVFTVLPTPEAFIANPPTDIVEYYNGGILVAEGTYFLRCFGDPAMPFLREALFLDPAGGTETGIPLIDNGFPSFCGPEAPSFNFLEADRSASIDPDASVSALVAGSIQQNIAGIDPDDTLVKASIFGPINYNNEEVGGNLTLKLEFAGRTFQTDARSVDILDDLSQPVTITNQDGVVMVISEDADGLATGSVTLDGEQLGTITEENGAVLVTYTDDTFVSIR